MKTSLFVTVLAAAIVMTAPSLLAQTTSSGTFNVTATIEPTISLTFASDGSGLALLSGSGTSTATLAFGNIQAYGYSAPTGVTQTVVGSGASATAFTVATPFDVLVMEANSTSTSYTLTAALNSADTNSDVWTIDGTTITTTPGSITTGGSYGSAASHTLKISIPFANTSGSISNAVNFVATAN
jgi:hypothetical protein